MATTSSDTHPLQCEWSVWEHHECDPKKSASGYSQSMKEIYRFKTVEDFWAFFNNYPKMREIFYDGKTKKQITREGDEGARGKCIEAVSVFKTGIKPQWEEASNRTGGGWYIGPITNVNSLEKAFEAALLSMIGETLDDGDDVNGMRVVDKSAKRKGCLYRLEVWTKTKTVKDTVKTRLEKALDVDSDLLRGTKLYFKNHSY